MLMMDMDFGFNAYDGHNLFRAYDGHGLWLCAAVVGWTGVYRLQQRSAYCKIVVCTAKV